MNHTPGDLAALTASPRRWVAPDGTPVDIAPLKVRQIQPFATALAPVLAGVQIVGGQVPIAPLLAAHADAIAAAIAVATGQSATWLGDLDVDVFIDLAAQVVEVNADFFARRVVPMAERQAMAISAALSPNQDGLTLQPA